MTDLTSLSDDELTALYQGRQQPSSAPPDLTKMSDDELKAAYAAAKPSKTDTSIGGAITHGAASLVQGYGKTIKDYISPEAGKAVLDASAAKSDPNYKSATEGFMSPEDGAENHRLGVDWSKLPRMLVEQAPGLAADLAVQAIVPKWMGPIGKYAANALSYGGRTAGSEAERRAAERTGDPNAEPNATDKLVGLGSTAAQTALNQHGLNKIISPAKVAGVGLEGVKQAAGNVAKAAIAEGGTSAAQNLISQGAAKAGTTGLSTIDPQEVIANVAAGTALGGAFAAPKGAREASIATQHRNATDEHSVMAANRIAEGGSVDNAKQDIRTELSKAASEVTNASPETDNAIVRAKAGDKLTPKDLAAVDAAGNEQLSTLVRQSAAISKLSDAPGGLAGTAVSFAKKHPIWTLGGVLSPHALATVGFPALDAALPGAGTLLMGAGAAYAGLRGVDSILGLRNKGATFAERVGDDTGQVRPDAPEAPLLPEPSQADLLKSQHSLESGLQKLVEKLQRQKQQQLPREAMPLLKQLAARNKLMQQQPAPGQPEQPVAPAIAEPKAVNTQDATPQPPKAGESIVQRALAVMQAQRSREKTQAQEEFELPESPYWHLEPAEASQEVLRDALAGGKNIPHPEGYRAATQRRMEGEDAIWHAINNTMSTHAERSEFAKYFNAMRGATSPPVMEKVRDAMRAEFPQYADTINKHLTDEKIKSLWTKEKKKKA